jgi:hypothetical protein
LRRIADYVRTRVDTPRLRPSRGPLPDLFVY